MKGPRMMKITNNAGLMRRKLGFDQIPVAVLQLVPLDSAWSCQILVLTPGLSGSFLYTEMRSFIFSRGIQIYISGNTPLLFL